MNATERLGSTCTGLPEITVEGDRHIGFAVRKDATGGGNRQF